jgi:hypothetical protein
VLDEVDFGTFAEIQGYQEIITTQGVDISQSQRTSFSGIKIEGLSKESRDLPLP